MSEWGRQKPEGVALPGAPSPNARREFLHGRWVLRAIGLLYAAYIFLLPAYGHSLALWLQCLACYAVFVVLFFLSVPFHFHFHFHFHFLLLPLPFFDSLIHPILPLSLALSNDRLPHVQGSAPLDSPLDFISCLKVSACSPPSTMSRRESRVSMNERQNDALFEFENCMFLPSSTSSHGPLSLPVPLNSQEEVPPRK